MRELNGNSFTIYRQDILKKNSWNLRNILFYACKVRKVILWSSRTPLHARIVDQNSLLLIPVENDFDAARLRNQPSLVLLITLSDRFLVLFFVEGLSFWGPLSVFTEIPLDLLSLEGFVGLYEAAEYLKFSLDTVFHKTGSVHLLLILRVTAEASHIHRHILAS